MKQEPESGLTVSAPVSDVSAPACTNGARSPLRLVSVEQKNKSMTMLSSNVKSNGLLMDYTTWRFSTMRQPNGCSTPARNLTRPSSVRRTRSIEEGQKKSKLIIRSKFMVGSNFLGAVFFLLIDIFSKLQQHTLTCFPSLVAFL